MKFIEKEKRPKRSKLRRAGKYTGITIVIMIMLAVPAVPSSRIGQVSAYPVPEYQPAGKPADSRSAKSPQLFEKMHTYAKDPDHAVRIRDDILFYVHIAEAAEKYNVDPALIQAIIMTESSFNPEAVSRRGAQGLMQLMPATAKSLGVSNSLDPGANIDGGVRYFRSLLDRFEGDVRLSLAAYNAGAGNVRAYGGIPPFRETQDYIKKIFHCLETYHNQLQSEDTYEAYRIWG